MGDRSKKLGKQRRRAVEKEQASPGPPSSSTPSSSTRYERREYSLEWRYPLPPPGVLQQYGFIKNGPERLLRMWERQATHRQKIENRGSLTESFQRIFGSVAAAMLGLGGLGTCAFLVYHGKPVTGLVSLILPLAVMLSVIQRTRPPALADPSPSEPKQEPDPNQTVLPLGLTEPR